LNKSQAKHQFEMRSLCQHPYHTDLTLLDYENHRCIFSVQLSMHTKPVARND